MAGQWIVSRGRRDGESAPGVRAGIGRVGSWSWRILLSGQARLRWRPAGAKSAGAPVGARSAGAPVAKSATAPVRTDPPHAPSHVLPPSAPVRAKSPRAPIRARWAVPLLAGMTLVAVLLTWTTIAIATRGVAARQAAGKMTAGPLVIPAPRLAGNLPRRFGPITDPAAEAIVSQFRQRFGVVGAGLLASAKHAAAQPGTGTAGTTGTTGSSGATRRQVTAAWTSGLYGEPGHIDPTTDRPAWVMYLGLDASAKLGIPSATITRLMTGILGPYAMVGPWRVMPGHRGGSANCTVAWLGQTEVDVCGWATDHTIGAVASPARDTSVGELATMMIKMRFDLQRS